MSMTFGSLFAGIGGFDLGLERAGMTCKWQVEINDYCRRVLTKHWPDVPKFGDIRECGSHNLEPVDLICGGFPCQPFSCAGKRKGAADDRFLWPEMSRIIEEIRPAWVIGENVPGIIRMELDRVLSDLESLGYSTKTFVIPSCAVGAPHKRSRVWIISHANKNSESTLSQHEQREIPRTMDVADTNSQGLPVARDTRETRESEDRIFSGTTANRTCRRAIEPDVGRVAHGVPSRMDRVKSIGNAVDPEVIEFIGRRILEFKRLVK